jgi:hypothetical protein
MDGRICTAGMTDEDGDAISGILARSGICLMGFSGCCRARLRPKDGLGSFDRQGIGPRFDVNWVRFVPQQKGPLMEACLDLWAGVVAESVGRQVIGIIGDLVGRRSRPADGASTSQRQTDPSNNW